LSCEMSAALKSAFRFQVKRAVRSGLRTELRSAVRRGVSAGIRGWMQRAAGCGGSQRARCRARDEGGEEGRRESKSAGQLGTRAIALTSVVFWSRIPRKCLVYLSMLTT
jgi:hypothetical protein